MIPMWPSQIDLTPTDVFDLYRDITGLTGHPPPRRIISTSGGWPYRGAECSYTGGDPTGWETGGTGDHVVPLMLPSESLFSPAQVAALERDSLHHINSQCPSPPSSSPPSGAPSVTCAGVTR